MHGGGLSRDQQWRNLRREDRAGGGIPDQDRAGGCRIAGVGQGHGDAEPIPGLDFAIGQDVRRHHGVGPGDHAVQRLELQIECLGGGAGGRQMDFGGQLVAAHEEIARGDGEGEIVGGIGSGEGHAG